MDDIPGSIERRKAIFSINSFCLPRVDTGSAWWTVDQRQGDRLGFSGLIWSDSHLRNRKER
jgi:hypothetical protein